MLLVDVTQGLPRLSPAWVNAGSDTSHGDLSIELCRPHQAAWQPEH